MSIGPLVIFLWLLLVLASCVAVGFHIYRHGRRRIGVALLTPLGAVLTFGFVSALIGVLESGWTPWRAGFVIAIVCGIVGVLLCVIGWRAVLRPRVRNGDCPNCGYPVGVATKCPECGTAVPPTRG